MFKKRKDNGIVINTGEGFGNYLKAKESAKALAKTKKTVVEQQHELKDLKSEMHEIKDLLKQLLDKK